MTIDNIVSNATLSMVDDEHLVSDSPAERLANFHLVDIYGNLVEEDIDYFLEMYDQPENVLKLSNIMDNETLYATYRLNIADKIIVRYSIIDGMHYLTREKKYFQVCEEEDHEEEVIFADGLPEKKSRLEFHVTENNTFQIAEWNSDFWLEFYKRTVNYNDLKLNIDEDITKHRKPLELLLRKDPKEVFVPAEVNDNFEVQNSTDPLTRGANFQLLDIEGNPVEQKIDYCLEMWGVDEDVLNVSDVLYATEYQDNIDKMIVQCLIINGIHYLVSNNKYFQAAVDDDERQGQILLSTKLPKKVQRLQFQVTQFNTFKVVQWNQRTYLHAEQIDLQHTFFYFQDDECELDFFLKRCEQ
ncbi:hypothetical protein INT43_003043 [Umbelopsis isabellina]|uniref:Uncharacterized protein n=1 Tax=Mortierella isabellina TaxID=91625 RepID=A0A8H7PR94_MORIS|nr:hypothetical protein INT43_003043 [Umbelopsis isabellina]